VSSLIEWSGDRQVRQNMAAYGERAKQVKIRIAQYWAPQIETSARSNATWTDRTGNARQALRAYYSEDVPPKFGASEAVDYPSPVDLAQNTVAVYLSHGMRYGLQLETRHQGRYAIIMNTLQSFYPRISQMLQNVFR